MRKSVIHIVLSITLLLPVVIPTMILICDLNMDAIVFSESDQDDSADLLEIELNEKQLIVYYPVQRPKVFLLNKNKLFSNYNEITSSFNAEIILPPPEFIG